MLPSLPLRAVMQWHDDTTRARFDRATRTIRLTTESGEAHPPIPVRYVDRGGEPAVLLFRFRLASEELPAESYDNVLEELGQVDSSEYDRRIVLVGSDADQPLPHFGGRRGYQIHAQIIANLLSEVYVRSSRPVGASGILACAALGVLWRQRRRRPEEIVDSRSSYRHWLLAGVDILGGILLLAIPVLIAANVAFRVKLIRLPVIDWLLTFTMTYLFLTVAERRRSS